MVVLVGNDTRRYVSEDEVMANAITKHLFLDDKGRSIFKNKSVSISPDSDCLFYYLKGGAWIISIQKYCKSKVFFSEDWLKTVGFFIKDDTATVKEIKIEADDKFIIPKKKITFLAQDLPNKYVFFDQGSRDKIECVSSSIDLTKNNYSCFWCRNKTDNAMGCPVEFVNSRISVKTSTRILYEDLPTNHSLQNESKPISKGYYLTDGVFCSFNCVKSFIKDNRTQLLYKHSEQLITKMLVEMFGKNIPEIKEAPHWRMLKEYGGSLTIEQFRNASDKSVFVNHGNTVPLCHLFENKISLN